MFEIESRWYASALYQAYNKHKEKIRYMASNLNTVNLTTGQVWRCQDCGQYGADPSQFQGLCEHRVVPVNITDIEAVSNAMPVTPEQ